MAPVQWIVLLGVVGAAIAICFALAVLLDVGVALIIPIFAAFVIAGAAGVYLVRPGQRP